MRLPKRRLLWLSAASLLALVVFGMYLVAPRSRINKANCDRIRLGMTEDEVCEILGAEHDESTQEMIVLLRSISAKQN
ncbi:MAG TPA: hypothetical protein VGY58_16545 [Gemmataceae bacterium]|jgi:hypothetical protein|nr:hypothetical protein [Gemmataceae bacterium]